MRPISRALPIAASALAIVLAVAAPAAIAAESVPG